ncbi:transposase, partial [Caballeronia sp. ATUFL_M1_KS5A]|uniref:transposase n=1 Tax=Caballeronia sp. ATUFL_M1_KS5A TaxID=2921778 RepID=UPI00202889CB
MDETLSRSPKIKRPNFPVATKRHLAEQTFEPGASVSLVARRNDINTNLLFRWRRQYLQGIFGTPHPEHAAAVANPETGAPVLLPVSIVTVEGDKWNERPHPPGGAHRRRRTLKGR